MKNWILFLFTGAAWGGSFLFMRQASAAFGPFPLACLRLFLGGLLLTPLVWGLRKDIQSQGRTVLLLGLLNAAIPFSIFAWAMKQVPAGQGAILNATTPLWVAVVGELFLKQRQGARAWAGLALGFAGVAVAVEPWHSESLPRLLPSLSILIATCCYGISAHIINRMKGLTPLTTAWINVAPGVAWLALPALFSLPLSNPSSTAWTAAIGLGVLSTGLAWWAFAIFFQAWGPLKAITVAYLIPFFGMFWGWLILKEPIQAAWWPGLALVLAGMTLVKKKAKIEN